MLHFRTDTLRYCSLTDIPYDVLQNIQFDLVNSDFIEIDLTANQISVVDFSQISNWKSRKSINLILTENKITVLKNFAFAHGNWNQIKIDQNGLTLIQSHAFANATFQDLFVDFASDCQFSAQLLLENIQGTLTFGLFDKKYFHSGSFKCFKNPLPPICPENAQALVINYCVDLLHKIDCCRDFKTLWINFPDWFGDLNQFQDYGKLVVPKIKSIDSLFLRWDYGGSRGVCFDASDFQQIEIAAVYLSLDEDMFFCENAFLSLANVTKNLSLEFRGGFSLRSQLYY